MSESFVKKINSSDVKLYNFKKAGKEIIADTDEVKLLTSNILNNSFGNNKFNESDSTEVFLVKIKDFFGDLFFDKNLNSFKNYNDFDSFLSSVNDMFKYIENNSKELLKLDAEDFKNLKASFTGIQLFVKKMPENLNFINRVSKTNEFIKEKSLIQMIKLLHKNFEKPYSYIIKPINNELPKILKIEDTILSIKSGSFIKDEVFFYETISNIENIGNYLLEDNNLLEFNSNQLNKIKKNIEIIFVEIENVLNKNNFAFSKKNSLESFLDLNGVFKTNIMPKIDNLIWKEGAVDMINNLPLNDAKELSEDEEKFNTFLNSFRTISAYIMEKKAILNELKIEDIKKIKELLMEVYIKIDEIGENALKKGNKKIHYNTKIIIKSKLANTFEINKELIIFSKGRTASN